MNTMGMAHTITTVYRFGNFFAPMILREFNFSKIRISKIVIQFTSSFFHSLKLISRKICGAEKSVNFHTVVHTANV